MKKQLTVIVTIRENKHERYYRPGRRILAYCTIRV